MKKLLSITAAAVLSITSCIAPKSNDINEVELMSEVAQITLNRASLMPLRDFCITREKLKGIKHINGDHYELSFIGRYEVNRQSQPLKDTILWRSDTLGYTLDLYRNDQRFYTHFNDKQRADSIYEVYCRKSAEYPTNKLYPKTK